MTHIVFIILPVFGLIGLGWLAAVSGYLGDEVGEGLSTFVFYVAVPCLIFRTMATATLPDVSAWGYWLAYFFAVGVVWLICAVVARRHGRDRAGAAVLGFSTAQSNTVLIGIPLILTAYGEGAYVPIFLLIAVHLALMMGAVTCLVGLSVPVPQEGRWRRGRRFIAAIAELSRSLVVHPILFAIGVGLLFRWSGLSLNAAPLVLVDMLTNTAIPCALFAMGLALKRHGLLGNVSLLSIMAGLKLVLQPALVYLAVSFVVTLPPLWAKTAVLFAACPCGINGYLVAIRYKTQEAETSGAVAVTTALSVISIAGWLWILERVMS